MIKTYWHLLILSCLAMAIPSAFIRNEKWTTETVYRRKETPPPVKPNIIVILADDMGYSDIGCFGSEIQTPNLDALAKGGLRMTQFYNASRCCPTRASLLTGLYPHQAGVGDMVNTRAQPAYQGYLNQRCVTIAEALKQGGYSTFMAGKWHVGTAPEHWPRKRGFDRYFGLIDGASSYFSLKPYRPGQKLTMALDDREFTPGEGFYATNAYTDYALQFIAENKSGDKPFFLYLAFTAPHWPLHALPQDIELYKETYKKGWDALRRGRFQRMQQLGIVDGKTTLSPRDKNVPAWESLSAGEKLKWQQKFAVYAAMVHRMDQNIGRIRQKLAETGADKNTMVFFLSDNGGSYESIEGTGFSAEVLAANNRPAGDSASFTAYEFPGANLSNTPFRYFKRYEYEGGTAAPFIAWYPGVIKPGRIESRPAHVIDIMATCLDLAGLPYPENYHGHSIIPTEGKSLMPLFRGSGWKDHDALFFEHEGNRAVRKGDWKMVSVYPANKWELYQVKKDRTELQDLSETQPQKVAELDSLYNAWAKRAGVIPFKELDRNER